MACRCTTASKPLDKLGPIFYIRASAPNLNQRKTMSDFSGNPWRGREDSHAHKTTDQPSNQTLSTPEDFFQAGQRAQEQQQYQQAIDFYSKAVELNPAYLEAWFYRGFNRMDLKRYEEAIEDFRKSLELEKEGNFFRPYSYYNVGLCYYNLMRDEEALPYFTQSVTCKPDYVPAINYVGLLHYMKKDYTTAMVHFQRCLEFDADYLYALYNMGRCHYYRGEDDMALSYFLRALQADGNHVEANNYAGLIYLNKKLYPTALGYFQKASSLDPQYTAPLYNLGILYYEQKQYSLVSRATDIPHPKAG